MWLLNYVIISTLKQINYYDWVLLTQVNPDILLI